MARLRQDQAAGACAYEGHRAGTAAGGDLGPLGLGFRAQGSGGLGSRGVWGV